MVLGVWMNDYFQLPIRTYSQEDNGESPPAKRPRFYDPFAANSRLLELSQSVAVVGDEY
jgi:hypothetical protein